MTLFALPNIAGLIFKAGGGIVRQYGEPGGGLTKDCSKHPKETARHFQLC